MQTRLKASQKQNASSIIVSKNTFITEFKDKNRKLVYTQIGSSLPFLYDRVDLEICVTPGVTKRYQIRVFQVGHSSGPGCTVWSESVR